MSINVLLFVLAITGTFGVKMLEQMEAHTVDCRSNFDHYRCLGLFVTICLFSCAEGATDISTVSDKNVSKPESYQRHRYVSKDIWRRVAPYFLPEDHQIKAVLDDLFSKSRVIISIKSMKKAGFIEPKPRKWTHLIVTKHPKLPGYIFKVYLDAQYYHKEKSEYEHWLERIQGASAIKKKIQKHHWEHFFKVPKKWIYPLPENPSPPKELMRKNFILVEEDMDIYDKKTNDKKWGSSWVTKEKLDALYLLLEELGLHDCPKPDNIPFSKDGRISFVDTQTFEKWPVSYSKLTPYLSSKLKTYWKQLKKKSKSFP